MEWFHYPGNQLTKTVWALNVIHSPGLLLTRESFHCPAHQLTNAVCTMSIIHSPGLLLTETMENFHYRAYQSTNSMRTEYQSHFRPPDNRNNGKFSLSCIPINKHSLSTEYHSQSRPSVEDTRWLPQSQHSVSFTVHANLLTETMGSVQRPVYPLTKSLCTGNHLQSRPPVDRNNGKCLTSHLPDNKTKSLCTWLHSQSRPPVDRNNLRCSSSYIPADKKSVHWASFTVQAFCWQKQWEVFIILYTR